jgi:hypothetical protein
VPPGGDVALVEWLLEAPEPVARFDSACPPQAPAQKHATSVRTVLGRCQVAISALGDDDVQYLVDVVLVVVEMPGSAEPASTDGGDYAGSLESLGCAG